MKIGLIVLALIALGLAACNIDIDPKYQEESCVSNQLQHIAGSPTPEMYRAVTDECARIYRRP